MVEKTVRARLIVLSDHRCLGCQPVLHLVTRLGTLIFVGKISSARDFIGARREASFALA